MQTLLHTQATPPPPTPNPNRFLRFVTGTPRLPPGGLAALQPRLTVVRKGSHAAAAGGEGGSAPGGHSLSAPSFGSSVPGAQHPADGDLPSGERAPVLGGEGAAAAGLGCVPRGSCAASNSLVHLLRVPPSAHSVHAPTAPYTHPSTITDHLRSLLFQHIYLPHPPPLQQS